LAILNDEKAIIEWLRSAGRQDPLPKPVDVALNLRVGYELDMFFRFTAKFSADRPIACMTSE
jgi:hypothetical protein